METGGSSYQGAGSFNPMTGAAEGGGYDSRGVLAFTRGIAGGFGGWEGNEYTGPYGESTIDYTYPTNHVRPHAVTARSNGDVFSYDANGNMTSRTQDGVTWTQVFDAENRLVSVSNDATPSTTTTYVYDGGGGRLKRIVNDGTTTTTTLYVGNMEIETVGSAETQRTVYYGGTFRIIGGSKAGLYYTHGDQLGSVSVLSDANGMKVANSDVTYAPFGEVRAGNQSELTDLGYTGQRNDDGTGGLMYYGARYYLPGLMRFISADSIVSRPGDPQDFNRFAYVRNNPVRLVDPSGHSFCDSPGEQLPCDEDYRLTNISWAAWVDFQGDWTKENKLAIYLALDMVFLVAGNKTPEEIINMVSGGADTLIAINEKDIRGSNGVSNIWFDPTKEQWTIAIAGADSENLLDGPGIYELLHEMGHLVDLWLGGGGQTFWSDSEWPKLVKGWERTDRPGSRGGINPDSQWTWGCWTEGGRQMRTCNGGHAPDNLDTRRHWNPHEDFAGSFASVIAHEMQQRHPTSIGGNDLSRIVCCDNVRGKMVDAYRYNTIMTVLQNHQTLRPKNLTAGIPDQHRIGKWR